MKTLADFKLSSGADLGSMQLPEETTKWIAGILERYENKSPDYVTLMYEDNAELIMGSQHIVGIQNLKAFYNWMYKSFETAEFELKSAKVEKDQLIFDIDVGYLLLTGNRVNVSWTVELTKRPQDLKVSKANVLGKFDEFFNNCKAVSGPPPRN